MAAMIMAAAAFAAETTAPSGMAVAKHAKHVKHVKHHKSTTAKVTATPETK